jgi:ATP-dependent protease Clp ATPase subunit
MPMIHTGFAFRCGKPMKRHFPGKRNENFRAYIVNLCVASLKLRIIQSNLTTAKTETREYNRIIKVLLVDSSYDLPEQEGKVCKKKP